MASIPLLPLKSYAQPKPTTSTPELLARQFREGFMRGCTPGKTSGIRNQVKYCNCLADSYLKRYDGNTLSAISRLSGNLGENGAVLVNIMISPEAKSCAAKN